MVTANFIYFRATPQRCPVVQRPLLLLAVVVRHVHHCPRPRTLVRPCPLALAGLPLPSRPRPPWPVSPLPLAPRRRRRQQPLLLLSTTIIAAAAHSTTTTAGSQWLSFVIDGGDGSCHRLQRRSMAVAAMASLPSTMTISAVGSIPPPPLLTTTVMDEDRHRRCQH